MPVSPGMHRRSCLRRTKARCSKRITPEQQVSRLPDLQTCEGLPDEWQAMFHLLDLFKQDQEELDRDIAALSVKIAADTQKVKGMLKQARRLGRQFDAMLKEKETEPGTA